MTKHKTRISLILEAWVCEGYYWTYSIKNTKILGRSIGAKHLLDFIKTDSIKFAKKYSKGLNYGSST